LEKAQLFGIIAIVTIIGFSTIACDDGGGNDTGINVGQLPEFPSGSTPAGTRADAETILAELRQSPVLDFIQEEIYEVIYENKDNYGENYNFSNRSLPNGFVKVSASETRNETSTGGFQILSTNIKAMDDLYDVLYELYENYNENLAEIERLSDELDLLEEERNNIQFANGNKTSLTMNSNQKGELTKDKTENNVTIAKGSIYETKDNYSYNFTVTTVGTYTTFRITGSYTSKYQIMQAFTVTTSSGSVKVILDITYESNVMANNIKYYYDYWNENDSVGTRTETYKYSGSLKIYGSNNTLLIDYRIVDEESLTIAQNMISYDSDSHGEGTFADALSAIRGIGYSGTVPQPSGGTFDKYGIIDDVVYVVWTGCTQTTFDAYKYAWSGVSSVKTAREIVVDDYYFFETGNYFIYICYSEAGGIDEDFITLRAGSIVLMVFPY
jgi:hypothetical protein